ncbi:MULTISPECIES: bifunctional 23S rRNA (guanine(2069)-N(7))-methyltransferase RlmK/23S rRNA (guanine(2445)-N(2))-methyltransferase RlmL [Vibrio]|uniref:Ribosomal RNA large subunit methyltransferase K/L n=1 Tax=Vibrio mediterranei TaxID=689 RepID=A0A3G4V533_9VIBR|nr:MULTISPECIES: bifunctional 23S rRNA (guanine(2069)-N(7))-methyltransferase RlmK/23S rRNA (guanine(2445)-N(2))-methyltransferase RlmL [Vibrio]AYV19873.1 bifunctional 23S rRNA (guanine(2069)-N(7))-methyltransferase RlmK/23S rRNA (guanine(2445)-N(2))-methyltransferase RlmL [Vibrio mediterranei]USD99065.1 bifunctional 23S rRNA (guanine(2069)-N(7))-methyltransferase RlmK/23S rRNA (guanine(2445)-N(2))-methyltransferase RlmL [Vibrio sp. SCSIO 43133]
MNQYLAVTSNGLENLLAQELEQLGLTSVKPVQAGVKFKASNEQIYRACLWSRYASRFVKVLSEFTCQDDMDLYLAASSINWINHFHSSKKFIVDFNGTNREIRNSQYGAMKVKDAVVDCFNKKNLPRPNISKDRADVRVHVRLHRDKALIGLDMVGSGLHQRGYRTEAGRAPLRETLAAAIVARSGWKEGQNMLDPMCGSGTLLIEAAMLAANMAPGVKRQTWCFEALEDFEPEVWAEVKSEANVQARRGVKKTDSRFWGFDNDPKVLRTAKENAKRAGVEELINFELGDASQVTKPAEFGEGVVVCNPPYGERLGTEPGLIALYTEFGNQLKTQFGGCQASIFSSSDDLLSCLRMRAEKQFKLNNGALQCHQKNYSISQRSEDELVGNKDAQVVAPDFSNRLKKNIGKIGKWAKKEGLDCYRIYDADLPDYNVAVDVYQDYLVIQEYAAPKSIPEETAKRRLTDVIRASIKVTGVGTNNVVLKVREKKKGSSQYNKLAAKSSKLHVNEYGAQLIVNLYDYLDTGLFLDHKITRRKLGEMASNKDFLNLFAYTGSATVHAALGSAKSTTTVDMSNTYLEWAKENMKLNGQVGRQHQYIQADCLQWLEKANGSYDLIFIDPPTFSNSKRMEQSFDVQRDHVTLMTNLKRLLREEGTIVFSNNKRHFKMDLKALEELGLKAENISDKTLPLDFTRNKHIHNCWVITHQK